jgi:Asparagine synthase (glutamine-hydrolyzing)
MKTTLLATSVACLCETLHPIEESWPFRLLIISLSKTVASHVIGTGNQPQGRRYNIDPIVNTRSISFRCSGNQSSEELYQVGLLLPNSAEGWIPLQSYAPLIAWSQREGNPGDLLDTISYFDDSEPNWDERHYFSIVEAKRGKPGIHLNIATIARSFVPPEPDEHSPSLPGIDQYAAERQRQFAEAMATKGYRVILSGVGGDEVLGGVPTPLPELADYLISGKIRSLNTQAFEFCLFDRTPLLYMLAKTAALSLAVYFPLFADKPQPPPWILRNIRSEAKDSYSDAARKVPRFGLPPSMIENGRSWWQVLETLPHLHPSIAPRYEYRYPYLDRDLVEFLYRIPREQLVRPGQRRSLMRRALRGIVPAEILERPRKGSLILGPLLSLQRSETAIQSIFSESLIGTLGLIDERRLKATLAGIAKGTSPRWWPALIKAINMEFWLRTQSGTLSLTSAHKSIPRHLRSNQSAKQIRAGSIVR